MRKLLLTLMVTVLSLTGCASSLVSTSSKEYDKAIAEFYSESESFMLFSAILIDGYSSTWSEAIENGEDFNVAVNEVIDGSQNLIKLNDETVEVMGKNLRTISEASSNNSAKYQEIYEECKELFSIASSINDQVNSPTGSLRTFNSNTNDLFQEYGSKLKLIETLLSDDVLQIIEEREKENEKEEEEEV